MIAVCSRLTRVEGPRSLIGFNLVDELANIKQPTLVIGGTADAITPERDSQRMYAAIPNARIEIFDGAGHMLMLERFEAVNALLIKFADEVGASLKEQEHDG